MDFELLDRYLLDEAPAKGEVVRGLLASPPPLQAAQPFYEGMRLLGARTPDLTLIALRLVLAGRRADDASVIALRETVARARGGDAAARREYRELLGLAGQGERA
ncbi:MAG TPA: hypothetical protein VJP76_00245 [Candidatus Tumulicola sp.]|nr:hypothetical protein [Candidatus Tumulicola sp.]